MQKIGLGLVFVLAGCVHHVPPENTALPAGLAWCADAKRVFPLGLPSSAGSSGDYALALSPCMRVMQGTELDEAGLILKMNTSSTGVLTGICLEAISFDEPRLLECVSRIIWSSSVKLDPNLVAQPYRVSLFLE